jgi:diguanylate cyclase (GGDEF)-like protein/PAS domain S-box-containing protein
MARRLLAVLPGLILLVGSTAAWQQSSLLREREVRAYTDRLNFNLNEVAISLTHRLKANVQILRGVAGLFAASRSVSREEFANYARSLGLAENYPGIQGIGFSEWIAPGEKGRHIERLRGEGFADYAIRPSGERDGYSAIIYLEPFDWRNRRAFGYDMWSEPVRRAAMARARDEGRAAMTRKVTLVQETEQDVQAGFLIYVPVYRNGLPTDTVEARRAALRGWAYSPLRMDDLINNFMSAEHPGHIQGLTLKIYDGESQDEDRLMYASPASASPDGPTITTQLPFAGSVWTIAARPGPRAERLETARSDMVLAGGLLLTLALTLLTLILTRSHARVTAALRETAKANRSLAEKETLLRTIYDSSNVAIFLLDLGGRITHANQRMAEMFTCPLTRLVGSPYADLEQPDERGDSLPSLLESFKQGKASIQFERRYRRLRDGAEFWGMLTGRPIANPEGNTIGLVGVIADISQLKKTEAAMHLARTVFDHCSEGIIVTDAKNRIISVNPAFTRITGFPAEEVLGQDPRKLASGAHSKEFFRAMWRALRRTGRWEGELWNRKRDGTVFPELLAVSRVLDTRGRTANYVGIFQDITARRQAEDRIHELAHHDYLTGLPNRAFFVDHLDQALALARRYDRRLAVLFLDLDRFKPVNDTYGHNAGDAVLCAVARRLKASVRASDVLCRQGGDEFLILVPEFKDCQQLEELANKLVSALRQPITWNDQQFSIGCSIGIATYPECGEGEDKLIQCADAAMYCAKDDKERHVAFATGPLP